MSEPLNTSDRRASLALEITRTEDEIARIEGVINVLQKECETLRATLSHLMSGQAGPSRDSYGRCTRCKGTGITDLNAPNLVFCTCQLGKDLQCQKTRDELKAKRAPAVVKDIQIGDGAGYVWDPVDFAPRA